MIAVVLGEVPALPLHTAGKYVAGAYVVLFALVLLYVAIVAIRLSRIESELGELLSMSERSPEPAAAAIERSDEHTAAGGAPPSVAPPMTGGGQARTQDPQRESTPAYPMKGHHPFRGAGK
jgi:hypothetical protein